MGGSTGESVARERGGGGSRGAHIYFKRSRLLSETF